MKPDVLFWIFVAIVTGVVESATVTLVSIWFCLGAVVTAICAYFFPSALVQLAVFIISSAVFLVFTRPILNSKIKIPKTPTNADRIIGKRGVVTEQIHPINGTGQIKVNGQIWSAKSENDETAEIGDLVEITEIHGVYAICRKTN